MAPLGIAFMEHLMEHLTEELTVYSGIIVIPVGGTVFQVGFVSKLSDPRGPEGMISCEDHPLPVVPI